MTSNTPDKPEPLTALRETLCLCAQFMDGVKTDALKERWWTQHDDNVRQRITEGYATIDALRAEIAAWKLKRDQALADYKAILDCCIVADKKAERAEALLAEAAKALEPPSKKAIEKRAAEVCNRMCGGVCPELCVACEREAAAELIKEATAAIHAKITEGPNCGCFPNSRPTGIGWWCPTCKGYHAPSCMTCPAIPMEVT